MGDVNVSLNSSETVLVVGLGNPGPHYAGTRHNIGYAVIDELLGRASGMPATLSSHKKTNAMVAELAAGRLGTGKVVLATPRTFMNLSGGPVSALAKYFSVPTANIVVIHDELELDFGAIKARTGGGDHGHNGLKSCTKSLGTKEYTRLAVGIGRPPGRMDPAAFVLKPFGKQEQADIPIMCADAADEVERMLK